MDWLKNEIHKNLNIYKTALINNPCYFLIWSVKRLSYLRSTILINIRSFRLNKYCIFLGGLIIIYHCMNQIKSLLALYSISISKSYRGSLGIVFRELFIKLGTLQLHGPLLCGQIYTPVLLLFIHIKISSWIIYILIFFLMVSC